MDAIIKQAVREELLKQQNNKQDSNKEKGKNAGGSSGETSNRSTGTERTVNRLSGLLSRIRNRTGAGTTSRKKTKMDKEHRIQIRWLHYDKDKEKFTPVRNRYCDILILRFISHSCLQKCTCVFYCIFNSYFRNVFVFSLVRYFRQLKYNSHARVLDKDATFFFLFLYYLTEIPEPELKNLYDYLWLTCGLAFFGLCMA